MIEAIDRQGGFINKFLGDGFMAIFGAPLDDPGAARHAVAAAREILDEIERRGLAGDYGGVTGSATIGAGLGANVLVGGSGNTIALQPVSFQGSTGLNVAAGIGGITLTPAP